ncbi:MAG: hypothetical protein A3K68_00880 [Euryarchaeota archaeon RBG_16_68_13]|nr:MAG: hypothetical protein A3K68_00880 [Euryarchaeota archaeon RBG_16_68_13]
MAGASLSRGDLLLLVVVLGAFGIADSAYLAFQFYEAPGKSWCDLSDYFSCTAVRESPYASFAGIPTAVVGVVGFGILLSLAILALRGREEIGPVRVTDALLAFAILGALAGTVLTLIEIFVIQAICILCVIGFALDLGILGLALLLRAAPAEGA